MKNKDKLSKPTSAGRVAGKGLSTKWSSYFTAGGRKEKKTSSESQTREVEELKAQVARILELVQEQVEQRLGETITVVVLSLTVEWGVGMERQGPSYGEVVSTKDVRVQALLGRSNSPTSRSPEAVEWIMNV